VTVQDVLVQVNHGDAHIHHRLPGWGSTLNLRVTTNGERAAIMAAMRETPARDRNPQPGTGDGATTRRYVLPEVVEHGSRWLVLDVKGIANDTLLGLSENTTRTFSEQQEKEITRVILAGLQEEGIAAEIRHIIPPSPPGVMSLIIPILRLYLPLKTQAAISTQP
jgi:hypothetical protein